MSDTPPSPGQFKPTRWSLVQRARGEGEESRRALGELCQVYWFPLYAWCRRYGLPAADAEDAVQGFFAQVLQKHLFAAADGERGKLRTFLLTALQRHVKDARVKARAERRGGGNVVSFDALEAETWYAGAVMEGESVDDLFERQWALTVLDQAVRRLVEHAASRGKSAEFAALRPYLTREGDAAEYREIGARLGMTEGAFKVAVHRLRARFGEALRTEVAETQPDGADVEEELAHLRRALRGGAL